MGLHESYYYITKKTCSETETEEKKEILKLNHRQNKQIQLTLLYIKLMLIQSKKNTKSVMLANIVLVY